MEPGTIVSAVRSQRVLYGKEIQPALIIIKEGKIHSILPDSAASMHTAGEVRENSVNETYTSYWRQQVLQEVGRNA